MTPARAAAGPSVARAADPAVARRPAPGTAPRTHVLSLLQRGAGNRAVAGLLAVQRCGGEQHEGCACANESPVQRQPPTAAPAEAKPRTTDLPAGSAFAKLPGPLLTVLGNSWLRLTLANWANAGTKPADYQSALEWLGDTAINTLVQVYRRCDAVGIWTHVQAITEVWTTSSWGIHYVGNDASIQAAVSDPKANFCKDTAVGESLHSGKSCWREMIAGAPGLHVCLPQEIHIDPHQTIAGRVTGVAVGGKDWVKLAPVCWYSLKAVLDHWNDLGGGGDRTLFQEVDYARWQISSQRPRAATLKATALSSRIDDAEKKLDAMRDQLRDWAVSGLEGTSVSPLVASVRAVRDDLDKVGTELFDLEHPEPPEPRRPPGGRGMPF